MPPSENLGPAGGDTAGSVCFGARAPAPWSSRGSWRGFRSPRRGVPTRSGCSRRSRTCVGERA
eukprot:2288315-Pleurochrysis_carterae.AAC.3